MGMTRREGLLNGMARMTYCSVEEAEKIRDGGLLELQDGHDDMYRNNIQISELNALNASLAVIKFKQLRGFYFDEKPAHNLLFEVGDCKIVT